MTDHIRPSSFGTTTSSSELKALAREAAELERGRALFARGLLWGSSSAVVLAAILWAL